MRQHLAAVVITAAVTGLVTHVAEHWNSTAEPSNRPAGVPQQAIWAGGPTGGSYIYCDIRQDQNANHCTVYNDYLGKVMDDDYFRLQDEDSAATLMELNYRGSDLHGTIWLRMEKS